MSPRNLFRFEVLLLFGALPFVAAAGSLADTQTNLPPGLKVSMRMAQVPGCAPVYSAVITSGTNRFYIGIPDGLHMNPSNPRKIVLSDEGTCFLTFRVVEPWLIDPADSALAETCKKDLLGRHPGAVVQNEFPVSAANHGGPAFDLEWKNAGGNVECGRFAFLSCSTGVLELTLTTVPDKFPDGAFYFSSFLQSLRTEQGGKLEILPPPPTN